MSVSKSPLIWNPPRTNCRAVLRHEKDEGPRDADNGGGDAETQPARQIYDAAALGTRWGVATKTIQNLCARGAPLPQAIKLPGARGPRWRLADLEKFEASAHLRKGSAPISRGGKRGRPRLARHGQQT